jgi:hypothetical protein
MVAVGLIGAAPAASLREPVGRHISPGLAGGRPRIRKPRPLEPRQSRGERHTSADGFRHRMARQVFLNPEGSVE